MSDVPATSGGREVPLPRQGGRTDRRTDRRYATGAPFRLIRFPSSLAMPSRPAWGVDLSPCGLCLEAAYPLKPHQVFFLRLGTLEAELPFNTQEAALLRSVSLVEVRWCRWRGAPGEERYRVGLRHL